MTEATEQKTATPVAIEPPADPVVKQHSIMAGGAELNYTTTTGLMPIKNEKGEIKAKIEGFAKWIETQTERL